MSVSLSLKWFLSSSIELPSLSILSPHVIMVKQEECLLERPVKANNIDCDGKWKGEDVCQQQEYRLIIRLISALKRSDIRNPSDVFCTLLRRFWNIADGLI